MDAELPLSEITVFELGSNVAGPYATWVLAELGAEVVKVERPEGDDARGWGPPFWKGAATTFHTINRAKKSIVVDLGDPAQADRLRARIGAEADVVLQNLRAGVARKFGFSHEELMRENPRLIYCNIHAFGSGGPLKDRPGYDAMMQAFGGIMSVTGDEGQPPVRAGISVVDIGTGMWSVIGILTALHRRHSTGRGGLVDASLFETALGWMIFRGAHYMATGEVPLRQGTAARGIVPYQAYPCADGHLVIAASNDRLFARLAEAVGRPEWLQDDRFKTNRRRVENREAFNPLLEEILRTAPRAHWQEKFDAAGVPSSPIQSIDEVLAHPQTEWLGMVQDTGDPKMKLFGLPLSIDGRRPPLRSLAPELGADTED